MASLLAQRSSSSKQPQHIRFSKLTKLQISVILILPETKGITLERMDKIFGEIDIVEAAENELDTSKQEAKVIQHAIGEEPEDLKNKASVAHVETVQKEIEESKL